jgi:hypothetical protein
MGDHRCTIKIEFSIHDKTYKSDMNVNYFADDDGCDERVKEFFRESWNDAYARYSADVTAYLLSRDRRELEQKERGELERLKAKYPDA